MKFLAIVLSLMGFTATILAAAAPQFPICTFDPAKGEYVCPTLTTSYISAATSVRFNSAFGNLVISKCGQDGLRKCTRERQGSECKNGQWEVVHRCSTGQQCDMKEGFLCCRTRGPGFHC